MMPAPMAGPSAVASVDLGDEVRRQAKVAAAAGLAGVVCSPQEVTLVRGVLGERGRIVVPGIRRRCGRAGRSGESGHGEGRGGRRCDSPRRRPAGAPGIRSGSRIPGVSRGGSLRGVLIGLVLLLGSTPGRAQDLRLEEAAERARQAWLAHDAVALVADSPQTPGSASRGGSFGGPRSGAGGGAAAGLPRPGAGSGDARSRRPERSSRAGDTSSSSGVIGSREPRMCGSRAFCWATGRGRRGGSSWSCGWWGRAKLAGSTYLIPSEARDLLRGYRTPGEQIPRSLRSLGMR